MPKRIFRRYMPDPQTIREHKHLRCLGTLLHDPNLWHLNRRSISGAFGVGLFMAWVPVPFQMLLAAIAAIPLRVNLPISIGLVWLTNPVTMPPMFYFAYKLGALMLGMEPEGFNFELTMEWLTTSLGYIWKPFLLGCLIVGVSTSLLGYVGIRLFWRYHVVSQLKRRRARLAAKQQN